MPRLNYWNCSFIASSSLARQGLYSPPRPLTRLEDKALPGAHPGGLIFSRGLNKIKPKDNAALPEAIRQYYRIPMEHPCLAGHFPGNPIVPGVVLLDYARRLLKHWRPDFTVTAVPQAKFHQRLHPEQNFSIQLTEKAPLLIKFECYTGDIKLASGILTLKPRR